jgi:CheY-like chemotaxis protein
MYAFRSSPELLASDSFDVLVVEDDRALREQIALALRDEGLAVATAADGMEALATLRSSVVRLVVLDLMLPTLSGRELAKVMHEDPDLADVPIVTVTAVNNVHLAPPGPVYVKPVRRDALLRAVRLHLARGFPAFFSPR